MQEEQVNICIGVCSEIKWVVQILDKQNHIDEDEQQQRQDYQAFIESSHLEQQYYYDYCIHYYLTDCVGSRYKNRFFHLVYPEEIPLQGI